MAGQTALITGATGLLGRQVVREFRLRGWAVKGTGFSRADGDDILKLDIVNEVDVAQVLDNVRYANGPRSNHYIIDPI